MWGTGGVTGITNNSLCDVPAVLLGRKGTIDRPRLLKAPFWAIDTTFYCIPKNDTYIDWLFWCFSSIDLNIYNEASGVPSISRDTLYSINILYPDVDTQYEQANMLNKINSLINLKICRKRQLLNMRLKLIDTFVFNPLN